MKRTIGLFLILMLILVVPVSAQDNSTSTPIEFTGTVDAINNATITVGGLVVDISNLDTAMVTQLENGMTVTISGNLDGGVVIAIQVVLPDDPEATEAPDTASEDSGITIQVYISGDGGVTWVASDSDINVEGNLDILVRFVITNTTTDTLTEIDLSNTNLDISGCEIPSELVAGDTVDCTVSVVIEADDADSFAVVVIVTGNLAGVVIEVTESTVIVEDNADEDDGDGVVIVIEGPVTQVEGNVVTIFNFNIQFEDGDPRLAVIQIGDVIRIEGEWDDNQPVIIAIVIIFVDVDVVIFEGNIWRDSGNCQNPPPAWAPANGWRRRCANPGNSGGGRGRGRGGSKRSGN
jgi:hypothetical protein